MVDPLLRRSVLAWSRPLDLARMNEAATALLGLKDFAAFCKRREGATTVRRCSSWSGGATRTGVAVARVVADAFCHSMVRALVGCLLAVGDGRRPPEWASELLVARVRDSALTVVHAHGLTLEEVGYPDDDELATQADRARARRELV